jgi:hypothetical protein
MTPDGAITRRGGPSGCGTAWATSAPLGPSIHRAILWVRYDRKIAGRARGFDAFDDRANRKRQ